MRVSLRGSESLSLQLLSLSLMDWLTQLNRSLSLSMLLLSSMRQCRLGLSPSRLGYLLNVLSRGSSRSLMYILLRSSLVYPSSFCVFMYTLLFLANLLLDFSPVGLQTFFSILLLLAKTEWDSWASWCGNCWVCGCYGTDLAVCNCLLTQMDRSFKFMRQVQSQSSMLAMIFATLYPQYSSASITRSFITASSISQFYESQHSSLGSNVHTSSNIIPNVKTLLFQTISSSATSSQPHLKAMMSSGEGKTQPPSLNFWYVLRQINQLGSNLKLPLSQKMFSASMSLQVTPCCCRYASAQVTPQINLSISSARNNLLVFNLPSSNCLRVSSTDSRNRIYDSVYISMQFLKGVGCNLSTPSQSTRLAIAFEGAALWELDREQVMFRGEHFRDGWGLLSY